jgi:hypothetical protein
MKMIAVMVTHAATTDVGGNLRPRRTFFDPASGRGFREKSLGRNSPETQSGQAGSPTRNGAKTMGLILLVLLLALLLGGFGFAIHALWIVAVVVFLGWLIGFGVARGEGSSGRARWYRW